MIHVAVSFTLWNKQPRALHLIEHNSTAALRPHLKQCPLPQHGQKFVLLSFIWSCLCLWGCIAEAVLGSMNTDAPILVSAETKELNQGSASIGTTAYLA